MKNTNRIGLIIPANIKYSPYVKNYISELEATCTDYHIISWNKKGIPEEVDYSFDFTVDDHNRFKILVGHLMFAQRCRKYIRRNHIEKLIIFTVAPSFFLGNRLLKKYSNRYIIDIRDDSPFIRVAGKRFVGKCRNAYNVVVSSPKYIGWTNRAACLCHNVDLELLKKNMYYSAKVSGKLIRIVFAGVMIEADENIKFLDKLKGDTRFSHKYIGTDCIGKETLKTYCIQNGFSNVDFEGTYSKDEIVDIYRLDADLVNIIRKPSVVNKNALPNKLYEAVISGVPIVVYRHNDMVAEIVEKYNLGIVIPDAFNGSLGDYLYESLESFDYGKYNDGRLGFLKAIIKDMSEFEKMLLDFIEI